MKGDTLDPKALIREAYNIEDISAAECRSIFLDWALTIPSQEDMRDILRQLLDKYESSSQTHPMTETLMLGLHLADPPRRRGGWRRRAAERAL
jgi:hypothetical protein